MTKAVLIGIVLCLSFFTSRGQAQDLVPQAEYLLSDSLKSRRLSVKWFLGELRSKPDDVGFIIISPPKNRSARTDIRMILTTIRRLKLTERVGVIDGAGVGQPGLIRCYLVPTDATYLFENGRKWIYKPRRLKNRD